MLCWPLLFKVGSFIFYLNSMLRELAPTLGVTGEQRVQKQDRPSFQKMGRSSWPSRGLLKYTLVGCSKSLGGGELGGMGR